MTAAAATRNQLAALYASLALYVVPRAGTTEIGARQPLTWSTPVDGAITAPAITFSIPANTTLTDFAFYGDASGGQLVDQQPFPNTYTALTDLPVGFTYEQD